MTIFKFLIGNNLFFVTFLSERLQCSELIFIFFKVDMSELLETLGLISKD